MADRQTLVTKKRGAKVLNTYSAYVKEFLLEADKRKWAHPGEHHFVAAYLLPRLNAITSRVPYYVNPDGMKDAIGDVLYGSGDHTEASIEVKFLRVRLTRNEFRKGIRGQDAKNWPTIFIGIGRCGLCMSEWRDFRSAYLRLAYGGKIPRSNPKKGRYGKVIDVDRLIGESVAYCFPYEKTKVKGETRERLFTKTLTHLMRSAFGHYHSHSIPRKLRSR